MKRNLTNGEFLWNVMDAVTRYNEMPIKVDISGIDIELNWKADDDETIIATHSSDGVAIAELGMDGLVISLDEDFQDWLNDDAKLM
jgi:hypothetical protein